ncbi:MAG: hypothetical protein JJE30_15250 [Desulfuromonadales bacterium]|nr:hypothetical protein [Desulfuromonadales bacterium]
MKFRFYVYRFTLVLAMFVLLHLLVWKCRTERLFSNSYSAGGDLARIGYLLSFKLPRKNHVELPLRHLSLQEYAGQSVDILTLGDSFSNGGAGGKNRYYQDYIASINGMSVLNVGLYKREGAPPFLGPVQTLLLINSGELDRIAPRAVLVSVSVPQAVKFLANPIDPGLSAPIEKVKDTRNYEWYDGSVGAPAGILSLSPPETSTTFITPHFAVLHTKQITRLLLLPFAENYSPLRGIPCSTPCTTLS